MTLTPTSPCRGTHTETHKLCASLYRAAPGTTRSPTVGPARPRPCPPHRPPPPPPDAAGARLPRGCGTCQRPGRAAAASGAHGRSGAPAALSPHRLGAAILPGVTAKRLPGRRFRGRGGARRERWGPGRPLRPLPGSPGPVRLREAPWVPPCRALQGPGPLPPAPRGFAAEGRSAPRPRAAGSCDPVGDAVEPWACRASARAAARSVTHKPKINSRGGEPLE